MTELQLADVAVIDRTDPEQAAAMVTAALVESRSWLAVAMQGSDPTPITEFKAWAATVEEATKQKTLGREIELDAAEMVRRAERGIGVAVRNGQESGEIRSRRSNLIPGGPTRTRPDPSSSVSPSSFFKTETEQEDAYAMTDGVTDERFDEAIAEAKAEGNLSRTNVVRKVRVPSETRSQQRTAERISELADEGFSSRQIAQQIEMTEEYVRRTARRFDIEIAADKLIGRTRRHDSNRIAQETVQSLTGLAMGVDLIQYDQLDTDEACHWAASLADSLRALNRFHKQIRKVTQ